MFFVFSYTWISFIVEYITQKKSTHHKFYNFFIYTPFFSHVLLKFTRTLRFLAFLRGNLFWSDTFRGHFSVWLKFMSYKRSLCDNFPITVTCAPTEITVLLPMLHTLPTWGLNSYYGLGSGLAWGSGYTDVSWLGLGLYCALCLASGDGNGLGWGKG